LVNKFVRAKGPAQKIKYVSANRVKGVEPLSGLVNFMAFNIHLNKTFCKQYSFSISRV